MSAMNESTRVSSMKAQPLFNRMPGVQLQSTMRKKIKIARWLTNKVAEYDVTNDFWTA